MIPVSRPVHEEKTEAEDVPLMNIELSKTESAGVDIEGISCHSGQTEIANCGTSMLSYRRKRRTPEEKELRAIRKRERIRRMMGPPSALWKRGLICGIWIIITFVLLWIGKLLGIAAISKLFNRMAMMEHDYL